MTIEDKRKELHNMLQMAVELEFATIPPYLTAALSIKPSKNRNSFQIIHSVYMEEMLHMVLAANTLNAIGGTVKLEAANIPSYPLSLEFEGKKFKDREFDVDLEMFSKNAIETFMKIELPEDWDEDKRFKVMTEMDIPGYTIGEFYNLIKDKLKALCDEISEEKVFIGKPDYQIGDDYYWSSGGKPIKVHSLKDAFEAINVIIEQGEGASVNHFSADDKRFFGQPDVPHFFRFMEIYMERKYKENDNPKEPPTGNPLPVDWLAVYPIKKNCTTTDFKKTPLLAQLNLQFNMHFTLMLKGMEKAFNGNPKSLYSAIMNDMHGMAQIGYKMVQLPIIDDNPVIRHGAPTFEYIDLTK